MKKVTYIFTDSGEVYDEYDITVPNWALLGFYKDKWWNKEKSRKIESKKDFILKFKGVDYYVTKKPYEEYNNSFEHYKYCTRERTYNRLLFFMQENNFNALSEEVEHNLKIGYLEKL